MTPRCFTNTEVVDQDQTRVLINNRGEVALRALETCKALGIGAVLACSDADLDTLPARRALEYSDQKEKYALGYLRGNTPDKSYNNLDNVANLALAYGCNSLYPGYGFLAENAQAARRLGELGIRFIGPPADVIEQIGNKASARDLAKACRVPMLGGSELLVGQEDAAKTADKLGYPVMLKAEEAGGGQGNRIINMAIELGEHFKNMSLRFGGVYLEKYIPNARHLEVQIAADKHGNIIALGERDCSPQRRFQKVMEESPANKIPGGVIERATAQAIRMAERAGYIGVGTWEFLVDMDDKKKRAYFMEVNPRIQVEAPVTEERYGINLIEWQMLIEQGKSLPPLPKKRQNHVIEARMYGEKPEEGFKPDSGVIRRLDIPKIAGVRVDLAYEEGDTVPAGFDTTIAKFIAVGENREEAREKLAEALNKTTVTGLSTNREFLLWLLNSSEFRQDEVTTTYIEQAWSKYQRERFRGVEGFLSGGEFFPFPQPVRFTPETFPQNITYKRREKKRNYSDDLARMHETNPDSSAYKFGIYQDKATGIRLMLGFWDFNYMGGTLGVEEGHAVVESIEIASSQRLPLVMIPSSGGAKQQENSYALLQMDFIASALANNPLPLFVNVLSGPNYGGLTASAASLGDVTMALDGSHIGLTGGDILAKTLGKKDRSELPPGTHTAHDHYKDRNIDLLVSDLEEARHRIMAFCLDLGLSHTQTRPDFDFHGFDLITEASRDDRPATQRFAARVGELGSTVFNTALRKSREQRPNGELTPSERMVLLHHPLRPTAADLLNPNLGLFESVSPLSNKIIVDDTEQFPSIIGAITQLGGEPVMVIGQQTHRHRSLDGVLKKEYLVPQGPSDFRWARDKVDLAERLNIPIIFFGDTMGADARIEAERNGISKEIAKFLKRMHEVKVPVISINLGHNGSGGGLTLIRPLDAAADLSNALTLVSAIDVQHWILTGNWPQNDKERASILDQLLDGTAEGRLRSRQVDAIIEEPRGGAHHNWKFVAINLRRFLLVKLIELNKMTPEQLLIERIVRIKHAAGSSTKRLIRN